MKEYLKGLDTLRAIAALIVVWGHIELLKQINGIPNLIDIGINVSDGDIAVNLFFVISGFLITYLLVNEKEKNGKVSLKKFYIRRILRIWPLYYIIILLSFFLFNVDYSGKTIALCLTIFPNIASAIGAGWPTSPQIWSIGVEEQFYLIWPLAFILIPEKKIPRYLITFFIGYFLLPHVIGYINNMTLQNNELNVIMNKFFFQTKFNCMSIGALFGFLHAKKNKFLNYLNNRLVAYISIILSILLWVFGFKLKYFTDELYSLTFVTAIYSIVVNPKIIIDNSITSFIGKISYGIYMYHWIVILLALKYIPFFQNNLLYNLTLYFTVFVGTILISWISYTTIETYFLNKKKHFYTT